MTPRPYQSAAIDALFAWLAENDGNPCVVLPTGAGKTPCMAWTIQRILTNWPDTRICVLAHIRELLEQGVEKMRAIWPAAPVGIYSAGLKAKDVGYPITYAGIQSIYRKACDFPPFDLVFVDEAHRIPLKSEGQYQRFIRDAKLCNPQLRVIGWTATPYRLAGGNICHPKYILNKVCFEANVKDLIDEGYLSPLRTKLGAKKINTNGIKKTGGDFNEKQLAERAMVSETVDGIASEAVTILNAENRQSVLFFCVTKEHARMVSQAVGLLGIEAPCITDDTPPGERTDLAARFKSGQVRGLCNVNVLSEGFDAQRVDAVVMIRPTESKGLYYQQVGRGLRLHPEKTDCLILDFAGNVSRHGPIDVLSAERPVCHTCPQCREWYPIPKGACPSCGWLPPPPEKREGVGGGTPRTIPSDPKALAEVPILSGAEPWEMEVKEVQVSQHQKSDKPPSLCVTYMNGFQSHREWVCLEHPGYAGHKARSWWRARFGEPVPATVAEAMSGNLFLEDAIKGRTESIMVRQAGRYTEVINARLRTDAVGAVAR